MVAHGKTDVSVELIGIEVNEFFQELNARFLIEFRQGDVPRLDQQPLAFG